jgi:hypothetical protein
MKYFLLGVLVELIAILCAYEIYIHLRRVPLYALFYTPIDSHIIVPGIIKVGLSKYSVPLLVARALLVIVNSLKWAGCIALFRHGNKIAAGIIAGILFAMIIISISFKDIPI